MTKPDKDLGWRKAWRSVWDNPISRRPDYFIVWNYLLDHACFEDRELILKNRKFKLKKGQLLTWRTRISTMTGVHESNVQRILKYLESEQMIEQINIGRSRIITIVNWGIYQCHEQINEQQMNSKRTDSEQIVNGEQELKKVNNDKKEQTAHKYSSSFSDFWKLYPNHVSGKRNAYKSWEKIKPDEDLLVRIMDGLGRAKYSEEWKRDNGRYVPMATTWLNQRRWDAEFGQNNQTEVVRKSNVRKCHCGWKNPSEWIGGECGECHKQSVKILKKVGFEGFGSKEKGNVAGEGGAIENSREKSDNCKEE